MEITKDTVFIHYGDLFDITKFHEVKNAKTPWVKPNGGYWASPVESDNGWKDWCLREDFLCFGDWYKDINRSQRFTIDGDAKILYIRNKAEVDALNQWSFATKFSVYPDFEKLMNAGYQAIYYEDNVDTHYPMMCWDCDSLLVLDPTIIKIIKEEN